jgi:hypothetical protein
MMQKFTESCMEPRKEVEDIDERVATVFLGPEIGRCSLGTST